MFVCNICKKVFPELAGCGLHVQYRFGYNSVHDGDLLDATICNSCVDKAADALSAVCRISPVVSLDPDSFADGQPVVTAKPSVIFS